MCFAGHLRGDRTGLLPREPFAAQDAGQALGLQLFVPAFLDPGRKVHERPTAHAIHLRGRAAPVVPCRQLLPDLHGSTHPWHWRCRASAALCGWCSPCQPADAAPPVQCRSEAQAQVPSPQTPQSLQCDCEKQPLINECLPSQSVSAAVSRIGPLRSINEIHMADRGCTEASWPSRLVCTAPLALKPAAAAS